MYCAFVVVEEVLGWRGGDEGATGRGGACAALEEAADETAGDGGPTGRGGACAATEEDVV